MWRHNALLLADPCNRTTVSRSVPTCADLTLASTQMGASQSMCLGSPSDESVTLRLLRYVLQHADVAATADCRTRTPWATRASRSPVPSPYCVLSPVVKKVSHAMPAGSSIHDFSDLA